MVAFTQTRTFCALVAPMDAEIDRLRTQVDQLARTIESKRSKNLTVPKSKRVAVKADENAFERCRKQLDTELRKKAASLSGSPSFFRSISTDDLIAVLGESLADDPKAGGSFSEDEQRLAGSTLSYEGKWEREIRARLGLQSQSSLDHNDTPFGEVKYAAGSHLFRSMQAGRKRWGALLRSIIRKWPEESLDPETWEAFSDGEVSTSKIHRTLPEPLREQIQQELRSDRVLVAYDRGIFFAVDSGYFHVPPADYSRAFSLSCITQAVPKYRIRRDYVEIRLLSTLGMKRGPDQVYIDALGHASSETIPVVPSEQISDLGAADIDGAGSIDGSQCDPVGVQERPAVPSEPLAREVDPKVVRVRVDDVAVITNTLLGSPAQLIPDIADGRNLAVDHLHVVGHGVPVGGIPQGPNPSSHDRVLALPLPVAQ